MDLRGSVAPSRSRSYHSSEGKKSGRRREFFVVLVLFRYINKNMYKEKDKDKKARVECGKVHLKLGGLRPTLRAA